LAFVGNGMKVDNPQCYVIQYFHRRLSLPTPAAKGVLRLRGGRREAFLPWRYLGDR
jgi:hypothetical protein